MKKSEKNILGAFLGINIFMETTGDKEIDKAMIESFDNFLKSHEKAEEKIKEDYWLIKKPKFLLKKRP